MRMCAHIQTPNFLGVVDIENVIQSNNLLNRTCTVTS